MHSSINVKHISFRNAGKEKMIFYDAGKIGSRSRTGLDLLKATNAPDRKI